MDDRKWYLEFSDAGDPLRPDLRIQESEHRCGLPTVYIRVLLNAACWWLFYSACRRLRKSTGGKSTHKILEIETAKRLLGKMDTELDRLDRYWMGDDLKDLNYVEAPSVGIYSDDPFAGAVLWLAFARDFMSSVIESLQNADSKAELSPTWRGGSDRLSSAEDGGAYVATKRFPDFAKKFKHHWQNTHPWRGQVDSLKKINDVHFPDRHLSGAWDIFFELFDKPTYAWNNHETPWRARLNRKKGSRDWILSWIRIQKAWRNCHPLARVWLAPLVAETFYGACVVASDRHGEAIPFDAFVQPRHLDGILGLGPLEALDRIVSEARFGYPLKI